MSFKISSLKIRKNTGGGRQVVVSWSFSGSDKTKWESVSVSLEGDEKYGKGSRWIEIGSASVDNKAGRDVTSVIVTIPTDYVVDNIRAKIAVTSKTHGKKNKKYFSDASKTAPKDGMPNPFLDVPRPSTPSISVEAIKYKSTVQADPTHINGNTYAVKVTVTGAALSYRLGVCKRKNSLIIPDKKNPTFTNNPKGKVELKSWASDGRTWTFQDNNVSPGEFVVYSAVAYNMVTDKKGKKRYYSCLEPSDETSAIYFPPLTPEIFDIHAAGTDSAEIVLKQGMVNVSSIEIAYSENSNMLPQQTTDVSEPPYQVTGLTGGKRYWFKCRAKNDGGSSPWTDVFGIFIGSSPDAPTMGQLERVSYCIGDTVPITWTYNNKDGSTQKGYKIRLNGNVLSRVNSSDQFCDVNLAESLADLKDGDTVTVEVRTYSPASDKPSPWSSPVSFKVYSRPELSVTTTSHVTKLPMDIKLAMGGVSSQTPRMWSISIENSDSQVSTDPRNYGITRLPGTMVYSDYSEETDNPHSFQVGFEDYEFVDGGKYKLTAKVTTDKGLTAESTMDIDCDFSDVALPEPDAGGADIDSDDLTVSFVPFCRQLVSSGSSTEEDTYGGFASCVLSVYRVEADGRFTLVQEQVDNDGTTTVTDPHPVIGIEQWYLIVATDETNGVRSYGYFDAGMLENPGAVIQWNGRVNPGVTLTADDEGENVTANSYVQKTLRLPYNVTITENNDPNVSDAEYFGREAPVSYYGTQLGYGDSLSCELRADDTDRISLARQFKHYNGDCYVRFSNGNGYWAHAKTSLSWDKRTMVLGVSIEFTRIEGGA